jgi:murein DD-endopeptidase MepM/ murein hydrolase activator NlpD
MIDEIGNNRMVQGMSEKSALGAIDPSINGAAQDPAKIRVKAAVKEFEALFVYEMLKEMRQSTQGGFLGKGLGNDIYKSLFDMEVARLIAGRGLGLGEMILKKVNNQNGKGETSASPLSKDTGPSGIESQLPVNGRPSLNTEKGWPNLLNIPIKLRIPVNGPISSFFGWREDPITGQDKFHSGVDIAAQSGEEIYPIKKGRVVFSGLTQGYGNTVIIDHQDGFTSKYSHNMTNLVSVGDEVDATQIIALVGNTGRSTGPHLHLEVRHQGEKIDPLTVVETRRGAQNA